VSRRDLSKEHIMDYRNRYNKNFASVFEQFMSNSIKLIWLCKTLVYVSLGLSYSNYTVGMSEQYHERNR
jgi:hypothetical protein